MEAHRLAFVVTELTGTTDDFAEAFGAAGGTNGLVADHPRGVDVCITERAATLEDAVRTVAGWIFEADPKARIETIEVEPTPELLGVREPAAAAA